MDCEYLSAECAAAGRTGEEWQNVTVTGSRDGQPGHAAMQQPWLREFAQHAHEIALDHAEQHDPALAATLRRAMDVIPLELRVCGTLFTALAMVGDTKDGRNHEHTDEHDVISIFVMLTMRCLQPYRHRLATNPASSSISVARSGRLCAKLRVISRTAPPASRYAAVSVQASHLAGTGTGGPTRL